MSFKSEEEEEAQFREAIMNIGRDVRELILDAINADELTKNEDLYEKGANREKVENTENRRNIENRINAENRVHQSPMNVFQLRDNTMIVVEVQGAINGGSYRGRARARNRRQRNPDRSRSNLRSAEERAPSSRDTQDLLDCLVRLEEAAQCTRSCRCERTDGSTEEVMLPTEPLELNPLSAPSAEDTEEAEVEDLIYEEITLDTIHNRRATKSWRSVPKYKLSRTEALQQEADLYHFFINEKNHEDTIPTGDDDSLCVVCQDNKATRVVIPCGHQCLCQQCARRMALMKTTSTFGEIIPKHCPLCRAVISLLICPKRC
ncbi:hypothetical protein O3M35_011562 [Rhynocoris fuscipes]|uniref:RING-type domain-containing protein n=1 Tax=Rhynocoris fuscipes TaxID=488301 RepID=A0AAW1CWN9_9HEMI